MSYYIGLMSGTSADGIDATLISLDETGINTRAHLELPYEEPVRQQILSLCQPGDNEIDRLGELDRQLGEAFAGAVQQLLAQCGLSASDITAIGSHGQTVRHRPGYTSPFTLQIADPNLIAERSGITVVADFRRRDMAAGGQGAPLAPAFHRAAFHSATERRVIANIGGMANITDLTRDDPVTGFDSGPGNALMDTWASQHLGRSYDEDGRWAASGTVNKALLEQWLRHPFFAAPFPKSTGREDFDRPWLEGTLKDYKDIPPENVQASLMELTSHTLLRAIAATTTVYDALYICGGGACNLALMNRLQQLSGKPCHSTAKLGIAPQQVEGAAFAWLAHQTLNRQPGNLPSVTGASGSRILGAIYPA
ncbi:anhydro-N-acetylmuramic acid kinase [Pseudomaricurvus sp. HS19]|uniref:anhydro-N-acetylmuramic acid kinase n=1 Tax=Pseudomaricurvus sp. HS19 TaxID=2692626 RepID=UPI00136988AC|nr:anhydro-N-acetylmuramic acid kinase [Pseudomaricurvus sp. HS19]MYM63262.1 anhydro-N-acetylmuramic acid kinase [Pseudomaricurvus sp. HS19]